MAFLLTDTAQHRRRTLTGLVAEALTIKAHTIWTHITKMTGTITLTTRGDLSIMFHENLKFPKPEEAGDRLRNPDSIVAETVVNIRRQGVFTPAVV